jgi:protoporphyrinogen/coproporphyrinogen III oxidase
VATLAYPMACFPKDLHGNGFLVPYTERSEITASTWTSNKWAGRSPHGTILIRCFMGRDGGMNVEDFSDEQLTQTAIAEIERILKASQKPTFAGLKRWSRAMPQKVVGHTELLAQIQAGLEGIPIHLIGASYRASGIPDCIRDGREAAAAVVSS